MKKSNRHLVGPPVSKPKHNCRSHLWQTHIKEECRKTLFANYINKRCALEGSTCGEKKATGKSFFLLFVLTLFLFDFPVREHLFSSFRLGHQPFGEALSHVCLPFLLLFFPKSLNCYSVYREFERGVPTGHYWVISSLVAAASKKKKRSFLFLARTSSIANAFFTSRNLSFFLSW